MISVSASDLRRAATIKDNIEELQSELEKVLDGGGDIVGNGRTAPKPDGWNAGEPRKMSAAGRAKIAAAARARWAKVKAAGKKRL
jgi:hypothetical protein